MTTILITGANRGLGLEFVKQYTDQGHKVIACCRNPQAATELTALSEKHSNQIQLHSLDVSKLDNIQTLATELDDQNIDILINNAGVYGGLTNKFGTVDYDSWQQTLLINALAPIKIAEAFAKHMTSSSMGKMVFISSKMGSIEDNTTGGNYVYRSSKTALNSGVKSLSIDLKSKGIAVLTLHPGWVQTDMGGPNGLINTSQSITGMKKVIDELNLDTTGQFLDYSGTTVPW